MYMYLADNIKWDKKKTLHNIWLYEINICQGIFDQFCNLFTNKMDSL